MLYEEPQPRESLSYGSPGVGNASEKLPKSLPNLPQSGAQYSTYTAELDQWYHRKILKHIAGMYYPLPALIGTQGNPVPICNQALLSVLIGGNMQWIAASVMEGKLVI